MDAFAKAFAEDGLASTAMQVCYAMAETVFAVTQTPLGRSATSLSVSKSALGKGSVKPPADDADTMSIVSCGRLIDETIVQIRGPDGTQLSDSEVGEIIISTPGMYDGYYLLPDTTAMRRRDGWHHSGDLGFIQGEELYVTGRIDDLIVVRGRNFYAHDIESIASSVEGIKPGRVVTLGMDNEAIGTCDVICLAEQTEERPSRELKRELKEKIEILSGLVLSKVVLLRSGSLVKTTSGKISREANRRIYLEGGFVNTALNLD